MRALSIPLLLALAGLAAQTAAPKAADRQVAAPAALTGTDTALSLNAKVLAELQAQAVNRAAQTAQYKAAVTVRNQQAVEVQRIANESEADYTARVAVWKARTAEACKAGNADACAKLAD